MIVKSFPERYLRISQWQTSFHELVPTRGLHLRAVSHGALYLLTFEMWDVLAQSTVILTTSNSIYITSLCFIIQEF